ncbi:MAG: hypothetical protein V4676_08640, partial [Bacteroidota bacterium]
MIEKNRSNKYGGGFNAWAFFEPQRLKGIKEHKVFPRETLCLSVFVVYAFLAQNYFFSTVATTGLFIWFVHSIEMAL